MESFSKLVFVMIGDDSNSHPIIFAMTLWQIWRERNSMVWNEKHKNVVAVVHEAASFLTEWGASRSFMVGCSSTTHQCKAWHPPSPGFWKVNVDAAFFVDSMQMGVGMVLRDNSGAHIIGRTLLFNSNFAVDVGEALGIYEALSWVKQLGLERIVVEGDSKVVFDIRKIRSTLFLWTILQLVDIF